MWTDFSPVVLVMRTESTNFPALMNRQPRTTDILEEVLALLLRGELSHAGTETIFHAALAHARGYIRWLVWHRNYSLLPLGLSVDDVAIDAIAELLSEIDGERMERLRGALREVVAQHAETNLPLDLAFKAVVLRTVRLNLARVFTEIHPFRARLLRALRRHVQATASFTRHDGIAGYWYSLARTDPCLELPAAPPEVLRAMLTASDHHAHPAASVLANLLESLRRFPALRQAVSEEDVLDLTLQVIQADHVAATPADTRDDDLPLDAASITQEILDVLESLRPWVHRSYVARGKLSESEASAMLLAAERYVTDLASAEDRGHFHYLRELLPGLTHADYRARYRNVYEYLLRNIFTTVRTRLQLSIDDQEETPGSRVVESS